MFWDDFDAQASAMNTKQLASGSIPPSGYSPAGTLYSKLRAAGLEAGLRPSWETLQAVAPILASSGLSQTDACLIQAWLGGAHDLFDGQFRYTSANLSAQQFCGLIDSNKPSSIEAEVLSPFVRGVYSCRFSECATDALAKIDAKAAELVLSAGKAKAKASAKRQDAEAEADAAKLRQEAFSAVGWGAGITVGTLLLVAGAVLAVKLATASK